jgi:addiction module RelB/DinJ family antitoxin
MSTKNKAQKILKKENVSMSLAFNTFLSEVIHTKTFPVTVYPVKEVPAHVARNWKQEMEKDLKKSKRYTNTKEMWKDVKNW